MLIKILYSLCLLVFSGLLLAHQGSHGNNECTLQIGSTELRLNGYQFQGKHPERHYCRHYPHLGQTIIKIDSIHTDLTTQSVELQLLKRQSWIGLLLQSNDAFSVIKQEPIQHFSQQVVSISTTIQNRDVYALRLRLHTQHGITEQQFFFLAGIPFAQVMVAIACLLLIMISFIFVRQILNQQSKTSP